MINPGERIESLKAGTATGCCCLVTFLTLGVVNGWLANSVPLLSSLPTNFSQGYLFSGAIAAVSGFLFGVTYRYIIRSDRNSHLKSGAVLAFGLVRGMAQLDGGLGGLQANLYGLTAIVGESLVLFAVAALLLDTAMAQQWLQPFKSD